MGWWLKEACREHWKNWTFYRDNEMSVICKFIDFIFIKVQIFPSFSQGKQNICKIIFADIS